MESSNSENKDLNLGCGSEIPLREEIILDIQTTTGGTFYISVDNYISIEELKRLLAHKLRVCKDKISLLYRERILQNGTLSANGVMDGSRIVLLPNVEAGLLTQRSENTVMHALESLNEAQVTDFLSGKAPLNLTMRLGDHMMLIQLQLSTMNPILCSTSGLSPGQSRTDRRFSKQKPGTGLLKKHSVPINVSKDLNIPSSPKMEYAEQNSGCSHDSLTSSENVETIQNSFKLVKNLNQADAEENLVKSDIFNVPNCDISTIESNELIQSPIKSLSNLVTGPHKDNASVMFESLSNTGQYDRTKVDECHDLICENLTSCLCNTLQADSNNSQCNCQLQNVSDPSPLETSNKHTDSKYKRLSALLHKTAAKNVTKGKVKSRNMIVMKSDDLKKTMPSSTRNENSMNSLVEASRNLTKTLKKLSKDVLTSNKDVTESSKKSGAAVIDSMKHHGKGIYSGTFSGTLNPALQDKFGRPKRDVTTIIHILNDLLCSSPQYNKQDTRITFEPTNVSPSPRQASSTSVMKTSLEMTDSIEEHSENLNTSTSLDDSTASNTPTSTSLCSYGECDGHYSSNGPSNRCLKRCALSRRDKYSLPSNNIYYPPRILSKENYMTKCKVQQLKLIMQERKQRREFRKMKLAPYPCSLIKTDPQVSTNKSVNSSTLSDSSAEEIDTLV